jgi:hypothetical protein
VFLPGMSWFGQIEAESRFISRKRTTWRPPAEIQSPQTSLRIEGKSQAD